MKKLDFSKDSSLIKQDNKGSYIDVSCDFSRKDSYGVGKLYEDNSLLLIDGIYSACSPSFDRFKEIYRTDLGLSLDADTIQKEILCRNPSMAACIIAGSCVNGWDVWKDAKERLISYYIANNSDILNTQEEVNTIKTLGVETLASLASQDIDNKQQEQIAIMNENINTVSFDILQKWKMLIFGTFKTYGKPSKEQEFYFIKTVFSALDELSLLVNSSNGQEELDKFYYSVDWGKHNEKLLYSGGFDFYKYLVDANPSNEDEMKSVIDSYEVPDFDTKTEYSKEKESMLDNSNISTDNALALIGRIMKGNTSKEITDGINDSVLINKLDKLDKLDDISKGIVDALSPKKSDEVEEGLVTSDIYNHIRSGSHYTKDDFNSRIFGDFQTSVDKLSKINEPKPSAADFWLDAVFAKKVLLLTSVPGNGKTTICIELAKLLQGTDAEPMFLTFNSTMSDANLIGGYHVDKNGWTYKDGIVFKLCQEAEKHPEQNFPIIFDEVNRADSNTVFAEILSGMSKRNTGTTTKFGKKFTVPDNVFFLMTMNNYDKSVFPLSGAIKDRALVYNLDGVHLKAEYLIKESGREQDSARVVIQLLDDINNILKYDRIRGEANCIGNRTVIDSSYSNYTNIKFTISSLYDTAMERLNGLDMPLDTAQNKVESLVRSAIREVYDIWHR